MADKKIQFSGMGVDDGLIPIKGQELSDGTHALTVGLCSDASRGQLTHIKAQLHATIGTVLKINNIPSWAEYIILYPESGNISYSFGEDPVFDAANSGTANVIDYTTEKTVGNIANNSQVTVRKIIPGTNTDLRLVSDTATAVVTVGFAGG